MKAAALAARLQWRVVNAIPAEATQALLVEETHLALFLPQLPQFKPLYLNFRDGKQAYRLRHVEHEQLVKACRVKGLARAVHIIDATAGLGKDALLLAASGATVTLIERQPLLACLLEDLLTRLASSDWPFNLFLHRGNALEYLTALSEDDYPDVIYLDPMFDHDAAKTALVKKDLQMLQTLALPPLLEEQHQLLTMARWRALHKVVVKRARLAQPLADIKPDYQLLGAHSRFDVYKPLVV